MRNLLDVSNVTQTSTELLQAIEDVSLTRFLFSADSTERLFKNEARDLHERGEKEAEILEALQSPSNELLNIVEKWEPIELNWSGVPFCRWDRKSEKWEMIEK